MRRTSRYHPLKWIVEARWPGNAFFEQIAAFNHDRVANDYARQASKRARPINGKSWAYRVVQRTGRGYEVLMTYEGLKTYGSARPVALSDEQLRRDEEEQIGGPQHMRGEG